MTDTPPVFSRLVIPAAIACHAVLAAVLSAFLCVWTDEAYSIAATGGTFSEMLYQARHFEGQPPLYFAILWLWRCVSDSVVWGRVLSILFSVLALVVSTKVVRRVLPGIHPAYVIVPIALHPLSVYAASELRVSALLLLISGVLLFLFIEAFLSDTPRRRYVFAYGLVSVAALYTYQYLGFILVANASALLVLRRWRPLAVYLATMAVVAVCYIPEAIAVIDQVRMHTGESVSTRSWTNAAELMAERVFRYAWPIQGVPFIEMTPNRRLIAPGILSIGIAAILVSRRRAITPILIAIWSSAAALFFIFVVVAYGMGWSVIKSHHASMLFLLVNLSVFGVIHMFPATQRTRATAVWSCIVALSAVFALYDTYKPMAKTGDWIRVAQYLEEREEPGEPIVVFPAESALPFGYHYAGQNTLVPIPQAEDFKAYDMHEQVLHDGADIEAALAASPPENDSIWVVTSCKPGTCQWLGVDFQIEVLEAHLAEHYVLEEDVSFFKSRVRRYKVKHAG